MAKRLKRLDATDKQILDKETLRYAEARRYEQRLESERKGLARELLPLLDRFGKPKHRVDYQQLPDGKIETATVSIKERDNSKIDPERLKKVIGAKAFNKLTTPVLDEAKVEAAIQLGEVDPKVVASCMTENEPTRYLEVRFGKRQQT